MGKPDTMKIDPDPHNNNLRILYITFAIMIGLLLLWIVIICFTKGDVTTAYNILKEMNNISLQTPTVTDSTAEQSI